MATGLNVGDQLSGMPFPLERVEHLPMNYKALKVSMKVIVLVS